MKSTRTNQTQHRTLFFGMLCLLAGMMCVAKGFSHNAANLPAAVSASPGERQGFSKCPPSATLVDAGSPQFTSLTPRYVTKRIADLEVGEEVVAKDPESGEVTTKRVANVFRKVSDHLRILQVRNPLTNEVQTIETTDDHPFWVAALGQWIDAKDLKLGDRLDDVDGGIAILESTSRELHPDGIPVFNFEVEDFHTYFVRAHGSRGPPVLTHNTECPPDGFVSLESVEQAARVASARLDALVTTPGINGLPGTGVFGDAAPELVTIFHTTSRSRAGKILGLGSYGPAQGFRADDAAFFAETSDVADLFNGYAKYYPGQTPATRYTRIEITLDRRDLARVGFLDFAGNYRDAEPLFDIVGNRAKEWIVEEGPMLDEFNALLKSGRAQVQWYNHPSIR